MSWPSFTSFSERFPSMINKLRSLSIISISLVISQRLQHQGSNSKTLSEIWLTSKSVVASRITTRSFRHKHKLSSNPREKPRLPSTRLSWKPLSNKLTWTAFRVRLRHLSAENKQSSFRDPTLTSEVKTPLYTATQSSPWLRHKSPRFDAVSLLSPCGILSRSLSSRTITQPTQRSERPSQVINYMDPYPNYNHLNG